MNISVIALGTIGLPVAAFYAARGHRVTGCDIDSSLVAAINQGVNPLPEEPGLEQALGEAVASGTLTATVDTTAGVAEAEVVVVLVPLGIDDAYAPNFELLDEAIAALARGVRPGTLILLETTVPVGTTRRRLAAALEDRGLKPGVDVFVAFSPERVQSGRIWRDLTRYPRVVGGVDVESTGRATEFYRTTHGVPVVAVSNAETAEFCKIAESVYRDVNIALANELALQAGGLGVDIHEVIPAANSQPQSHLHRPGLGVGGHCIPVYPYFLDAATEGVNLARSARALNDSMPPRAVEMLCRTLGGLGGRRVLVLGLTYRPGVRETRLSPAVDLVRLLREQGAVVAAHDPLLDAGAILALGASETVAGLSGAGFDALVLTGGDPAYGQLDPADFGGLRVLLDAAGLLDPQTVSSAGVAYLSIGRPARDPAGGEVGP